MAKEPGDAPGRAAMSLFDDAEKLSVSNGKAGFCLKSPGDTINFFVNRDFRPYINQDSRNNRTF